MMTADIATSRKGIAATADLPKHAMKLSGLITTLFQQRGVILVGGWPS